MRKKFLPIIIVAIVAVCVVVAGTQLHWWGGGGAPPPSGNETPENPPENPPVVPSAQIFVIEGSVLVWKAGAANWTDAEVGMTLKPGDVVKSGDGSSAQITFFDGSTIDLEAGTEVEVVSLAISQAGSTTIKLKQTLGSTISRVEKLVDAASTYEVETPACVAAVRGSVMLVDVIEDGTTWVTNQEGNICVTAQGVTQCIGKGHKYIIIPGYPPLFVASSGPTGSGGGGGGGEGPRSGIALEKTPSATQVHDYDILTYTYVVTNTGDLALSNVTVTDESVGYVYYQSGDSDSDGRLDTDESWVYTATIYVTGDYSSPLVNEATASGVDTQSRTVTARDSASVEILRPDIDITKTPDREEAYVGEIITYTYRVTNPGNTPLYITSISDNVTGQPLYQSGDTDHDGRLDTNETWTYRATHVVTSEDESPLVNTVTVTGEDALGLEVTAQATASVTISAVQTASIYVRVTFPLPDPGAWIYMWDATLGRWAIDEFHGWEVDGTHDTTPGIIAVAGGHYYYVWIDAGDGWYGYPTEYPEGWELRYYPPPEGYIPTYYGYAVPDVLYSLNFTLPS